jgi:Domain of unknown function (DUF4132)
MADSAEIIEALQTAEHAARVGARDSYEASEQAKRAKATAELRAEMAAPRQFSASQHQLLAEWIEHWVAIQTEFQKAASPADVTMLARRLVSDFEAVEAQALRTEAYRRSEYYRDPECGWNSAGLTSNALEYPPDPGRDQRTFDHNWFESVTESFAAWQALGVHNQWWVQEYADINLSDYGPTRLLSDAPVPHADLLSERFGSKITLFELLGQVKSVKPSPKWLNTVADLVGSELGAQLRATLLRWLSLLEIQGKPADRNRLWPLADNYQEFARETLEVIQAYGGPKPAVLRALCTYNTFRGIFYSDGSGIPGGRNSDPAVLSMRATEVLRGAVWALSHWRDEEVVACLGQTTERLLVKLFRCRGQLTHRSLAGANACMLALSEIGTPAAVIMLERIKQRTRDRLVANQVEKAKARAAENAGLTVSELEELSVPTCEFARVGDDVIVFGDVEAQLRIVPGQGASVTWVGSNGKPLKSVPTSITKDKAHAEELKALKARVKLIDEVLSVQRHRIEALYLTGRTWPLATWRERYLDHPLVAMLARRLIWRIEQDGKAASVIWCDGRLVDVTGSSRDWSDGAVVSLWHPLDGELAEVTAWRLFLMRHRIMQPFKQAHRETYPLTDAERSTGTYSNRFAGHVLRQHQAAALARTKSWTAGLQAGWDGGTDDPWWRVSLPTVELKAEFGVNGIADQFAPQGSFVFVTTDRVRFVSAAPSQSANPANHTRLLADVPPRLLSEVLRDVDLMVGVASIGNDPTWADQGPDDHRRYWQQTASGEIGQTGEMRRQILADIVPCLKIASVCRLTERYLHVQGKRHEYRIHLGSGNILMENDRYLCIVSTGAPNAADTFIPFEGDGTLAVILSKALMLANDDRIKDATILSQL